MNSLKVCLVVSLIFVSSFVSGSLQAAAEPKPDATKTSEAKQKEFGNPKEAADALVQAAETYDVAALTEILGADAKDLISSEDPVMDKEIAASFVKRAKEKSALGADANNKNHVILTVGNDDFQLPIPIVNRKGKWVFDTKAGRDEMLNRRVGSNELDAIAICRGFDEAQHEYALEKHDDAKVNQFAQKIISTPGKHDGLAWQGPDGKWEGPIGENVAKAIEQGYSEAGKPYHGYYFKVLKKQGPAAPLGAMDFVVDGAMIGGFALAAAPAQYRVTGVQTFMVGADGNVYQRDLGPDTLKAFQALDQFNPDKSWQATDDDWDSDAEPDAPAEEPAAK